MDNSAIGIQPDTGGYAFQVTSKAIDLSLLTGNTASGSGALALYLSGTLSTSGSWSPTDGQLVIDGQIDVPPGITLTIEPGTVVKSDSNYVACGEQGAIGDCSLSIEGALDAVGTASQPITFTSVDDNSVGTVTGSGSPTAGWYGIEPSQSGSIDIEHADIEYSAIAVSSYGSTSITIVNSTITASEIAVEVNGTGSAIIEEFDHCKCWDSH